MENGKYLSLVQASKTSMPTVSRVLNHKGGVDSETRKTVLELAIKMQMTLPPTPTDIYVILPQVPSYFWGTLYNELRQHLDQSGLKVSYHFRAKGTAEVFVVRHYLEDALACGAKAILIAAPISPDIQDALRRCTTKCPVFFLCSGEDGKDTYFFGTNAFDTGVQLAKECNQSFQHGKVAITGISPLAEQGFLSAFTGTSSKIVLGDGHSKTTAAHFARSISALLEHSSLDAVICLDGITSKICLALHKLRLDIPCYGLEYAPADIPYLQSGKIAVTLCQDLTTIAHLAATAAERYIQDGTLPEIRNTYVTPLRIVKP